MLFLVNLLFCISLLVSTPLDLLMEDNRIANVNTTVYCGSNEPLTAAPRGYEPFYISHYGRHGSRTDSSTDPYAYLLAILNNAEKFGILTKEGYELLDETKEVVAVHGGMPGHLTRLGEKEEMALGRKLYNDYAKLFKTGNKKIRVESSNVPRVLVSMSCFTGEMKKLQNDLEFTVDTGDRVFDYINSSASPSHKKRSKILLDSLKRVAPCDTFHVYERLFTDVSKAKSFAPDYDKMQRCIYCVARIAESSGIKTNVYRHLDISTIYKWWDYSNRALYLNQGNSVEFGDERIARNDPLIIEIIKRADTAISDADVVADLKFGHDYPLMAMTGFWNLENVGERLSFEQIPEKWNAPDRICMGSNMQMVFYKNKNNDVLVKFVYNGKERKALDLTPVSGPYYKWSDVRAYALEKLDMKVFVVPEPVIMKFTGKRHVCTAVEESIEPKLGSEAYTIDTRGDKVIIKGGDKAGLFYAKQTLRQLRAQKGDRLPGLYISDKPAFKHRGGMLDCCRHFFEVDKVKRYIDILAMHKMNVFHWHLTDDQGWRPEIKAYPRLTEVGAWRKHTLIGQYGEYLKSGKILEYDETPHGGFYTQEQMREIVAYAAERNITVIPEIEMPGHSLAILASYPELGCTGGPYDVPGYWGVHKDIICGGNDSAIEFYKKVLDEICEIFPSEYIHIGGDEAPRTRWKECTKCQARIKEQGLKNEAELQSWMVRQIEAYLKTKGRHIIGWDEILEGGVDKSATVMSWRGNVGGKKAASMGNKVIMTPDNYCYLNYFQTYDPVVYGESIGHNRTLTLSKAYSFNPYEDLKDREKKYILGVQANLWTEYIENMSKAESRLLPRLAAIAEVCWNPDARESCGKFVARMEKALLPIYKEEGLNYFDYAFRNPPVLK